MLNCSTRYRRHSALIRVPEYFAMEVIEANIVVLERRHADARGWSKDRRRQTRNL